MHQTARPAMTVAAELPAKVSARLLQSMRQLSTAVLALAAEMPAATAAMTAFVATLRTHLPAAEHTAPDAIGEDGRHEYDAVIWHDLLWYGHVKSAGVTASAFTRDGVLGELRAQIAGLCELSNPDIVALKTLPG